MSEDVNIPRHFIADEIRRDLAENRYSAVRTRFPPEPNGFLHIGHAKAFIIDFGLAEAFGGTCNLRMDDTNPEKEDPVFVEAIQEDIRWLGFFWAEFRYASDYFEQLYTWALDMIRCGLAYVDDQTAEEMSRNRGTLTLPGVESPCRNRSAEENLELFEGMRAGKFAEGSRVLRAKIDMAHPNLNMRDPAMYRIKKTAHHRTGDRWCIYPTYDWAHGQSDSIEGITHSLCSLEFEDHRPLYNWFIEKLGIFPSRQIEFARLNLSHTVMSKRRLRRLVEEGHVRGWDDPRMPTLRGLRRRGVTPEGLRAFIQAVGVTKFNSVTELALLEHHVRQDLEEKAPRRMAVLDPLRVVITNFPEGEVEWYAGPHLPADPSAGERKVPLTREIFIEQEDFMEDAPKKFFRLSPGREVRLRYACYITCRAVVRDDAGRIQYLEAEFDPESRGGSTPDGRKVKGTIHWVSATHHVPVEVRLYEPLFSVSDPEDVEEGEDWISHLNPQAETVQTAFAEPALAEHPCGDTVQFERKGYFCRDKDVSAEGGKAVWNRTVALKDSWSRQQG